MWCAKFTSRWRKLVQHSHSPLFALIIAFQIGRCVQKCAFEPYEFIENTVRPYERTSKWAASIVHTECVRHSADTLVWRAEAKLIACRNREWTESGGGQSKMCKIIKVAILIIATAFFSRSLLSFSLLLSACCDLSIPFTRSERIFFCFAMTQPMTWLVRSHSDMPFCQTITVARNTGETFPYVQFIQSRAHYFHLNECSTTHATNTHI